MSYYTIAYYLQALVPHAMPNDGALSLIQNIFRETPSLLTSVVSLFGIWLVFLALAGWVIERKEYVLEQ